jgi:hypothetical protein
MAPPPHWDQTKKRITTEIEWIFIKSPHEVAELLSPEPAPYPSRPNIVIGFPGFLDWLPDFASDHIPALVHKLKDPGHYTLKHEILFYRKRKRAYEGWVTSSLDAIRGRATGKAVLQEIAAVSRRTIRILPYKQDDEDDYNASARPYDDEAATATAMPLLDKRGKPLTGSGSGQGSDVEIDFSPAMWGLFSDGRNQDSKPSGPGSNPDEVLFHELVHACRDLRGLRYRLSVNRDFDNEEEYLAVVIGNIYSSERCRCQNFLRASHHGFAVLQNPDKFLDAKIDLRPRMLLERLRLSQGTLFYSLAQIGPGLAKFNPVWKYNEELKQGEKPPR